MSEPKAPLPQAQPAPRKKPHRLLRGIRLLVLLALLLAVAQTEPHVYRFTLRSLAALEAWRGGYSLTLGEIRNTLFEPLEIHGVTLERTSQNGTRLQAELDLHTF